MTHEALMRQALEEAQKAFDEGEIPVGAVIARKGEVIAR
ncbi:MAG: deaminase, partial [Clostridia bacterium]|nr:deaminase [Clostridia bacterium]